MNDLDKRLPLSPEAVRVMAAIDNFKAARQRGDVNVYQYLADLEDATEAYRAAKRYPPGLTGLVDAIYTDGAA